MALCGNVQYVAVCLILVLVFTWRFYRHCAFFNRSWGSHSLKGTHIGHCSCLFLIVLIFGRLVCLPTKSLLLSPTFYLPLPQWLLMFFLCPQYTTASTQRNNQKSSVSIEELQNDFNNTFKAVLDLAVPLTLWTVKLRLCLITPSEEYIENAEKRRENGNNDCLMVLYQIVKSAAVAHLRFTGA